MPPSLPPIRLGIPWVMQVSYWTWSDLSYMLLTYIFGWMHRDPCDRHSEKYRIWHMGSWYIPLNCRCCEMGMLDGEYPLSSRGWTALLDGMSRVLLGFLGVRTLKAPRVDLTVYRLVRAHPLIVNWHTWFVAWIFYACKVPQSHSRLKSCARLHPLRNAMNSTQTKELRLTTSFEKRNELNPD